MAWMAGPQWAEHGFKNRLPSGRTELVLDMMMKLERAPDRVDSGDESCSPESLFHHLALLGRTG
jgi:hypothetical protein